MNKKRQWNWAQRFEVMTMWLNHFFAFLAGISLLLMMFVIVLNGILRIWNKPFAGITEVVGWLAALTIGLALGFTQLNKGHVDLSILTDRLPEKWSKWIQSLVLSASLIFFGFVFWQLIQYALRLQAAGHVTEVMRVAYYPFVLIVALGFLGLILAILMHIFQLWKLEVDK